MSDDVNTGPIKDPAWKNARTIWLAGGMDLPKRMNSNNTHYLADLKLVAGMVQSADVVSRADRLRKKSPRKLADLCRSLSSALSHIDDPTLARMAGSTSLDIRHVLNESVANLFLLEATLGKTMEPAIPRKRKHDLNDMAIIRLADIFDLKAKASASVTKHWEGSTRSGFFVNFVLKFYELMLPDFASSVSGRSIQASLEKRSTWTAMSPKGA
jgi:hypothetical protein